MTLSTRIILQAFLKRCQPKEREELMQYLAQDQQQAMATFPAPLGDPLQSEETPEKLLDWIHTSWISPFLRTLSEREIGLFLASLSPEKSASVGRDLLYTSKLPSISDLGKTFLQITLAHYLTAEMDELLPIACLPKSPLSDLIELPIGTIPLFLNLLGLHDLSLEVKQIIDRQKLSKIYETLTEIQHQYLKILLQSYEPVAFSSMGLLNWNGDQEKLKLLIEQRGANRLAKALYGQNPSFSWYVLHRFDVEKALLIRKLSTPIDNPRASHLLTEQVVELINYIKGSAYE